MDVSVVMVTFNGKEVTIKGLKSFESAIRSDPLRSYEIIVVDNASSDGVSDEVKKNFPWVTLIESKENLGFSKANNIGFARSSGKYTLFSNPDIEVNPNVLPFLVSRMEEDPSVGAATPLVKLVATGEIDWVSHRGFPTPWAAFTYYSGLEKLLASSGRLGKFFGGYHLKHLPLSVRHEVDSVTGAFLFVRRSAFEKAGRWDERYFMYGEDIDLCYQIKKLGLKIMFYPEVTVLHYHGLVSGIKAATSQVTKANVETRRKAYDAFYEAMKIFYDKNFRERYPAFIRAMVFLGVDIRKALGRGTLRV